MRSCFKVTLPIGFVDSLNKPWDVFLRGPSSAEIVAERLRIPLENVSQVSHEEFELVALDNCFAEPPQMELFTGGTKHD